MDGRVQAAGDAHANGAPPNGEEVRCLACSFVYRKPVDAITAVNPNCPNCGYAGWISVAIPIDDNVRRVHRR